MDDPDIEAALDAMVEAAPPLPYEVRARLAWLLRGHHNSQANPAATSRGATKPAAISAGIAGRHERR